MLKVPAPFPHPGSEALFGDRRVRINSTLPNGDVLITGKGIARHVSIDQLSDASLPDDPMGRWYGERAVAIPSAEKPDACPTPTEDLYRDFLTFCRARGVEEYQTPSRMAFGHFLNLKGHGSTVRKVDGRNHRCVDLMLRPIVGPEGERVSGGQPVGRAA